MILMSKPCLICRLPQVSCGLNHTLVLSLDGMVVWAFGDGDYGKLGTGSSTAKYYPQVSEQPQQTHLFFHSEKTETNTFM